LKLAVIDSESIKARIEAHTLDLGMVFEDELLQVFSRKPLFRQRLYLVRRDPLPGKAVSISFDKLATLDLILPSLPNVTRSLLDRTFAAAGISPNIVAEADVLSGIISAVNTGMGSTVLPKGDLSDIPGEQTALLIEPPLFLTASIISSGDFPLTYAGEAVQNVLIKFAESHFRANNAPGLEWMSRPTGSVSTAARSAANKAHGRESDSDGRRPTCDSKDTVGAAHEDHAAAAPRPKIATNTRRSDA
jgi:LysR family nitrogen assimilation transcriptional regulator